MAGVEDADLNEGRAERVLTLLLQGQPDPMSSAEAFQQVVNWSRELDDSIKTNLDADSIWAFVNLVYERFDLLRRQENAIKGGKVAAENRELKVSDEAISEKYRALVLDGKEPNTIPALIAKRFGVTPTTVRNRLDKLGLRKKRKRG